MHASQLVELAAGFLPICGEGLCPVGPTAARQAMTQYWVASRSRLERWRVQLDGGRKPAGAGPVRRRWPTIEMVVEEFFLADVLAQIWAAWLAQEGCPRDLRAWHNVAAAVVRDHGDLRARILRMLLAETPFATPAHAAGLNILRRRAQRWTELLLESLGAPPPDGPDRARSRPAGERPARKATWILEATGRGVVEAVGRQFPRGHDGCAANPDLNRAVAAAVVAGLGGALATELGRVGSDLWAIRTIATMELLVRAAQGEAPDALGTPAASRK